MGAGEGGRSGKIPKVSSPKPYVPGKSYKLILPPRRKGTQSPILGPHAEIDSQGQCMQSAAGKPEQRYQKSWTRTSFKSMLTPNVISCRRGSKKCTILGNLGRKLE